METEEFISGFCRTYNGSQTVCCEYEEKDGKRTLTFMDCAYKRCVNQGACEIYKPPHRLGSELENPLLAGITGNGPNHQLVFCQIIKNKPYNNQIL